ncbi:hypothetical protein MMC34_002234 [Xylographa carneopallida]|nr:hypothetical protein [Xylographa carneopallida]
MFSPFSLRARNPTIFGLVLNLTKLFFGLHLFTEYVAQTKLTAGYSMLPTLNVENDWVYVSCFYRRGRGVRVGDLVTFRHPMFPGTGACKRVLGLPGDFVLRDTPGSDSGMMVQIPEGHCWLAGDNLPDSRDSRDYGPLPMALIKGKVIAKILPFTERKWMENTLKDVDS